MTDFATLALQIDSTAVKTGADELDKLTAAGGRVEKATKGFQGEWVKASSEAGRLRMGLVGAEEQMNRVTASAGAQKAGMQQLGYQLGDAATMFASGSSAAQIFGTQLGQTLQAVQLMSGGTSGLAAFLGGPWGIALTVATTAMIPFISRLFDSESAAKNAAAGYRSAADEARGLAGAMNGLKLAEKQGELNKARERALQLEIEIDKFGGRVRSDGTIENVYKQQQELKKVRWEIVQLDNVTKLAEAENEKLNKSMAATARTAISSGGAVATHARAVRASTVAAVEQKPVVDAQAEAYARLAKEAGSAAAQIEKALNASLKTGLGQMQDEIARGTSGWLEAANDNAKATADWNTELQDTIRLLDQLGGFGQVLGNIGSIFEAIGSGNWQNVNGPLGIIGKSLGGVLNNSYVTGMDDDGRWIKSLGEVLRENLDKVFGGQGSFVQALQSAGVGMAAGGLINGQSNSGFGSAVGGILGEVAGKAIGKTIGGTLGKALGPLGSIAGGILGGALGGLFKTVQSGYAQVRSGTVAGTYGRTGELQSGAAASAGGIVSQINSIADALGVTAGAYDFDIGKKDDKFVLNTGSRGVMNFDTEAQAVEAALREAVADGAFNGISDGAKRLLEGSGGIQGQLAKAVTFQNVFTALQEKTDPLGYSLGQIDKQFAKLKTIFDEAGATAGEYAQLEQLIAAQRQEVIDDDAADKLAKLNERRSLEVRLMEAQGNASAALAMQREIERSETDASLRAILGQIYAAEDLARAQQTAAAAAETLANATRLIANERSGIEEKLLQLQGNTAALRARELAALDPSNRALQKQVFALEDAQAAQNALTQATEQAQSRFKSFADQLRGFADDLTGTGGAASYRGSRAQLMATGALAAAGNEDALSKLTGVSQAFLEVARNQASSSAQYQREVAFVRGYLNTAIAVADGGGVTGIAGASGTPAQIAAANGQVNASLLSEMQAMRAEVAAQRAETRAANEALVIANNKMMRLQERWDRGGSIAVVTDADRPIVTEAA